MASNNPTEIISVVRTAEGAAQGLSAGAPDRDVIETLVAKQAQLRAMLTCLVDSDGLRAMDYIALKDYMWGCEWLATECLELVNELDGRRGFGHDKGSH